ncbi:hypothetical protein PUN28_014101 [Cardiocondyla obscurior]|uniref:Uncharacterized protein n=1 Tax=Cardiocondyla obscurior TaxID=286306 RepID=A0AAW2F0K8_9HYME
MIGENRTVSTKRDHGVRTQEQPASPLRPITIDCIRGFLRCHDAILTARNKRKKKKKKNMIDRKWLDLCIFTKLRCQLVWYKEKKKRVSYVQKLKVGI